jgi:hypothetical protein
MIKINNNQNTASYDFIPEISTLRSERRPVDDFGISEARLVDVSLNAEIINVDVIEIHPLPLQTQNIPTNYITCQSAALTNNDILPTWIDHDDSEYYCPPSRQSVQFCNKCCTFWVLFACLFSIIILVAFFSDRIN